MTKLTKGDRVRSIYWPANHYVVLANNNGWLTVRCAEPHNADLVFDKQRANKFSRI